MATYTISCKGTVEAFRPTGQNYTMPRCYDDESDGVFDGWLGIETIIPVQPEQTDATSLTIQLAAVNAFDPAQVSSIIAGCLVLFIMGFGVGVVIKLMRRN